MDGGHRFESDKEINAYLSGETDDMYLRLSENEGWNNQVRSAAEYEARHALEGMRVAEWENPAHMCEFAVIAPHRVAFHTHLGLSCRGPCSSLKTWETSNLAL